MPQPRKEQILDMQTRYTRVDAIDGAQIGSSTFAVTPSTQFIDNNVTHNYFTDFLAQTVTGTIGGAETSAFAVLTGGLGPYNAGAGASFSITMTGVNGGAPVAVTIVSGDIVMIGGIPVVTVAHAAYRINAAFTSAGHSSPVAFNNTADFRSWGRRLVPINRSFWLISLLGLLHSLVSRRSRRLV